MVAYNRHPLCGCHVNPSVLRFPLQRKEIVALPVKLPIVAAPIGTFCLNNRTLSPVAKLFIECTRDVGKPLARGK